MAEKKGLELRCETTPETDRTYTGDASRIRQIVDNLVSNAIKFTSKGNVSLTVNYGEGQLIILVGDTGKGIAKEEQGKIFQEFTRLKNAQGEEGFGLGLAIVKHIIEAHGERITVRSELGVGSTFSFTLRKANLQEMK